MPDRYMHIPDIGIDVPGVDTDHTRQRYRYTRYRYTGHIDQGILHVDI